MIFHHLRAVAHFKRDFRNSLSKYCRKKMIFGFGIYLCQCVVLVVMHSRPDQTRCRSNAASERLNCMTLHYGYDLAQFPSFSCSSFLTLCLTRDVSSPFLPMIPGVWIGRQSAPTRKRCAAEGSSFAAAKFRSIPSRVRSSPATSPRRPGECWTTSQPFCGLRDSLLITSLRRQFS